MDSETRIAPASGAGPPDAVEPRGQAPARRPARDGRHPALLPPPLLPGDLVVAARRSDAACGPSGSGSTRTPVPIARGVEQAGNVAVRASRGAVKVGHAAGEIGGKLSEWGRARRDAGGARLRRIGKGMRRFGSRATRIGTQAEDVAESVEDLGDELASLVGNDAEPKRRPRPSSAHRRKAARKPRPRLPRNTPAIPPPPESASSAAGIAPDAVPPNDASDGELPGVFRDRIRALGKRRRSKPLRRLIVDICAYRDWTTVGDLAEWLGVDESNLQKRHLRPMLKSGQLRLRYPENKSHPEQGYTTAGA